MTPSLNKYELDKIARTVEGMRRQAAGFEDQASNPMIPLILREALKTLAANNREAAATLVERLQAFEVARQPFTH